MNPEPVARLERLLVCALLASFALPLVLGFLLLYPPLANRVPPWVRNLSLGGVQTHAPPVPLSRASLLSAAYQHAAARKYDESFVGREMMIRLVNEIYLRLFRASPSGLIVGRNLNLFETVYAEEYCLQRGEVQTLSPFVADLQRMQDFCESRGIAFALVITPSKAAIYPEDLPPRWQSRYRREPRFYHLLLPLLERSGIQYVDGHQIADALKRNAAIPIFPRGGTHWGDEAALATTNALLELLARQGLPVRQIHDFTARDSSQLAGQDRDLFDLANLVSRWSYPVMTITVPPTTPRAANRPNMVVIGGSFSRKILKFLDASRQLSEADFYFYYHNSKKRWADGQVIAVGTPTPPVNFDTDVYAADAIVLECNEQTLRTPASHLTAFLHDALANLPDPHAPKAPFQPGNVEIPSAR